MTKFFRKGMATLVALAMLMSVFVAFPAISFAAATTYTVTSYGNSGGTMNAGTISVASSGTAGTAARAADVSGITHNSGSNFGSSRIGVMGFTLTDIGDVDADRVAATLKFYVTYTNNLNTNGYWTRIGVYETANPTNLSYALSNMDATTFPAVNDDYSYNATYWTNERLRQTGSGGDIGINNWMTVDVSTPVRNAISAAQLAGEDDAWVVLRLQAPIAGISISVASGYEPYISLSQFKASDRLPAQNDIITVNGSAYKVITGENLIPNGSFEDEEGNFTADGWKNGAGNRFSPFVDYFRAVTSGGYHDQSMTKTANASMSSPDGTWAITSDGSTGQGGNNSIRSSFPVTGGKTYYVSYKVANSAASASNDYIKTSESTSENGSETNALNVGTTSSTAYTYTTQEYIIDTASTTNYIQFSFRWMDAANWMFDDFMILEVEESNITEVVAALTAEVTGICSDTLTTVPTSVTGYPDASVTWSTSDSSIATVSAGAVSYTLGEHPTTVDIIAHVVSGSDSTDITFPVTVHAADVTPSVNDRFTAGDGTVYYVTNATNLIDSNDFDYTGATSTGWNTLGAGGDSITTTAATQVMGYNDELAWQSTGGNGSNGLNGMNPLIPIDDLTVGQPYLLTFATKMSGTGTIEWSNIQLVNSTPATVEKVKTATSSANGNDADAKYAIVGSPDWTVNNVVFTRNSADEVYICPASGWTATAFDNISIVALAPVPVTVTEVYEDAEGNALAGSGATYTGYLGGTYTPHAPENIGSYYLDSASDVVLSEANGVSNGAITITFVYNSAPLLSMDDVDIIEDITTISGTVTDADVASTMDGWSSTTASNGNVNFITVDGVQTLQWYGPAGANMSVNFPTVGDASPSSKVVMQFTASRSESEWHDMALVDGDGNNFATFCFAQDGIFPDDAQRSYGNTPAATSEVGDASVSSDGTNVVIIMTNNSDNTYTVEFATGTYDSYRVFNTLTYAGSFNGFAGIVDKVGGAGMSYYNVRMGALKIFRADSDTFRIALGTVGSTGSSSGTGVLVATGAYNENGNTVSAPYIANTTGGSSVNNGKTLAGSNLGSSRIGVIGFTVDADAVDDAVLSSAKLRIYVNDINDNLKTTLSDSWIRVAAYATSNPTLTYTAGGMTATDFAAANDDYSDSAAFWSEEKIADVGQSIDGAVAVPAWVTIDVTDAVLDALDGASGDTTVVFRIQTVLAGFNMSTAIPYAPYLELDTSLEGKLSTVLDTDCAEELSTLPLTITDLSGSTVTWVSSSANVSINNSTGAVTYTKTDAFQNVTLTANATYNGDSATYDFPVHIHPTGISVSVGDVIYGEDGIPYKVISNANLLEGTAFDYTGQTGNGWTYYSGGTSNLHINLSMTSSDHDGNAPNYAQGDGYGDSKAWYGTKNVGTGQNGSLIPMIPLDDVADGETSYAIIFAARTKGGGNNVEAKTLYGTAGSASGATYNVLKYSHVATLNYAAISEALSGGTGISSAEYRNIQYEGIVTSDDEWIINKIVFTPTAGDTYIGVSMPWGGSSSSIDDIWLAKVENVKADITVNYIDSSTGNTIKTVTIEDHASGISFTAGGDVIEVIDASTDTGFVYVPVIDASSTITVSETSAENVINVNCKAYAVGANIVTNADFSSGMDGWTTDVYTNPIDEYPAKFAVTDYNGCTDSLRIISAGSSDTLGSGALTTKWKTTVGSMYYFSVDMAKTSDGDDVTAYIEAVNSSNTKREFTSDLVEIGYLAASGNVGDAADAFNGLSADWSKHSYIVTMPERSTYLGFRTAWTGDSVYIDNAQLRKITPAVTAVTVTNKCGDTVLSTENFNIESGTVYDLTTEEHSPATIEVGGTIYLRDEIADPDETITSTNNTFVVTYTEVTLASISGYSANMNIIEGNSVVLPDTLTAHFTNGESVDAAAEWTYSGELSANGADSATVTATATIASLGETVTSTVTVYRNDGSAAYAAAYNGQNNAAIHTFADDLAIKGPGAIDFKLQVNSLSDTLVSISNSATVSGNYFAGSGIQISIIRDAGIGVRDGAETHNIVPVDKAVDTFRVFLFFDATDDADSDGINGAYYGALVASDGTVYPVASAASPYNFRSAQSDDKINSITVLDNGGTTGAAVVSGTLLFWDDDYWAQYNTAIKKQTSNDASPVDIATTDYVKTAIGETKTITPSATYIVDGVTYDLDSANSTLSHEFATAGASYTFSAVYVPQTEVTVNYKSGDDVVDTVYYPVNSGDEFTVSGSDIPAMIESSGNTYYYAGNAAMSYTVDTASVTVIDIPYDDKTLDYVTPVTIRTYPSVEPTLPDTLTFNFTDGTSKDVAVEWEYIESAYCTIDSAAYEMEYVCRISGTDTVIDYYVASDDAQSPAYDALDSSAVTVYVYGVSDYDDNFDVLTTVGIAPVFPTEINITYVDENGTEEATTTSVRFATPVAALYGTEGTSFSYSGSALNGYLLIHANVMVTEGDTVRYNIRSDNYFSYTEEEAWQDGDDAIYHIKNDKLVLSGTRGNSNGNGKMDDESVIFVRIPLTGYDPNEYGDLFAASLRLFCTYYEGRGAHAYLNIYGILPTEDPDAIVHDNVKPLVYAYEDYMNNVSDDFLDSVYVIEEHAYYENTGSKSDSSTPNKYFNIPVTSFLNAYGDTILAKASDKQYATFMIATEACKLYFESFEGARNEYAASHDDFESEIDMSVYSYYDTTNDAADAEFAAILDDLEHNGTLDDILALHCPLLILNHEYPHVTVYTHYLDDSGNELQATETNDSSYYINMHYGFVSELESTPIVKDGTYYYFEGEYADDAFTTELDDIYVTDAGYDSATDTYPLNVYVKYKAKNIVSLEDAGIVVTRQGTMPVMPESVIANFDDNSTGAVNVTWDLTWLRSAIATAEGTYTINGSVDNYAGSAVCRVTVFQSHANNLIYNPSFEYDYDGWTTGTWGNGVNGETYNNTLDKYEPLTSIYEYGVTPRQSGGSGTRLVPSDGSKAARIYDTGGPDNAGTYVTQTVANLTENEKYVLSFDYRTGASVLIFMQAYAIDSDGYLDDYLLFDNEGQEYYSGSPSYVLDNYEGYLLNYVPTENDDSTLFGRINVGAYSDEPSYSLTKWLSFNEEFTLPEGYDSVSLTFYVSNNYGTNGETPSAGAWNRWVYVDNTSLMLANDASANGLVKVYGITASATSDIVLANVDPTDSAAVVAYLNSAYDLSDDSVDLDSESELTEKDDTYVTAGTEYVVSSEMLSTQPEAVTGYPRGVFAGIYYYDHINDTWVEFADDSYQEGDDGYKVYYVENDIIVVYTPIVDFRARSEFNTNDDGSVFTYYYMNTTGESKYLHPIIVVYNADGSMASLEFASTTGSEVAIDGVDNYGKVDYAYDSNPTAGQTIEGFLWYDNNNAFDIIRPINK